jgi:hypothetical protein
MWLYSPTNEVSMGHGYFSTMETVFDSVQDLASAYEANDFGFDKELPFNLISWNFSSNRLKMIMRDQP